MFHEVFVEVKYSIALIFKDILSYFAKYINFFPIWRIEGSGKGSPTENTAKEISLAVFAVSPLKQQRQRALCVCLGFR